MKYLLTILIIASLASCRTTKYVERERVVTDSTGYHKADSILQVKRQDSAAYTSMIESLSENTIIFQDTGRTIIKYRSDGSIEVIEGQLRSANLKLNRTQNEAGYWRSAYDSLSRMSTVDSVRVQREIVTVTKNKKTTVLPWWLILIAVAVLFVGWKWGKIK
jgi:hypothetical protein